MSAHSEGFPWPSYYGHFNFFEQRMDAHSQIVEVKSLGQGSYELTNRFGKVLKVFICECYSFGVAEYLETKQTFERLDVIIINSAWCGYTMDAKRSAREAKIGLYKIGDFMAALNKVDVWSHLNEPEQEVFKQKGWL